MADMRAKVILDLEDRLSSRADKAMRRMSAMEDRVNRTSRASDRAAKSSGRMNGALALAARYAGPVAVGASIYKSTKAAIDFESAMADVNKVVDFKSPHAFKQMEQDILRMSTKLPMAAGDIAAIVASAGQANIPTDQLLKFAESASKMGIAFDIGASEAGDVMAGLRTIFDRDQKGVIGLADAINHLSNNANATAPALLQVLQRSGAMAKQFGLTAEQNTALAGTFLSLKVPPQVAGTAINSMLNKLGNADKQNKKFRGGMKSLGITTKQWSQMMEKDAQGALNTFLNKLNSSKDSKGIIFDMFGLEYSDDIARLLGNMKEYNRQQKLISDPSNYSGSMEAEYKARAATTANNLQLLQNNLKKLAITTGSKVLPILNRVVEATNNWLSNLDKVATVFDKVGAAASGFAQGLGFEGVGDALDKLTEPLQRVWRALTPADADAGETLGRIFIRSKQAGEQFVTWMDSVDQKLNLGERFASAKATLVPKLAEIQSFAEEKIARTQEIIGSIDFGAAADKVIPKLEKFANQITSHFNLIADGLSKFMGDFEISTDMEAWSGEQFAKIADTFSSIIDIAADALKIVDNALTYLGSAVDGIAQGLGFESAGKAAGAATDVALKGISWAFDAISWVMGKVSDLFSFEADATTVEDPEAVVNVWKSRTEAVVDAITSAVKFVVDKFNKATELVDALMAKVNKYNPFRESTPEEKAKKQEDDKKKAAEEQRRRAETQAAIEKYRSEQRARSEKRQKQRKVSGLENQKSSAVGSLGGIANPWGPGNNWTEGVDLSQKLETGKISLEQFRAKMAEVIAEGGKWSEVAQKMDVVAQRAQSIQTQIDAIDLTASGQKIMNTLAAGISAGTPAVQAASSKAAATVKGAFPHSPAKYGPLRSFSGRGTINQLVRTMPISPLQAHAKRMAAVVAGEDYTANGGVAGSPSTNGRGGNAAAASKGSVTLQGGIHIQVNGSGDPEATAKAVYSQFASELDGIMGDAA